MGTDLRADYEQARGASGGSDERHPLWTRGAAPATGYGETTVGTFVGMASATAAEVCAAAGADWVLIDLEHGSGSEDAVRDGVLAAGSYGVPTVVRVESGDRIRIGRVLDQGAAGIMVPRLDKPGEVAAVLTHLLYPPHGDRGVATYNRSCRWGMDRSPLHRPTRKPSESSRSKPWKRWRRSMRSPPRTASTCSSSVRWICPTRSGCRCSSTAPSSRRPRTGARRRGRARQDGRHPGRERRHGARLCRAGLPVRRHRLRLDHHGRRVPRRLRHRPQQPH